MRLTWLGWAGAELETEGATVVIDPLDDAAAVFAPLGDAAHDMPLPRIVAPTPGRAVAGLVTHLHRDHADARALAGALVPGAPVLEPPAPGGHRRENLALLQADQELDAAGLTRQRIEPWESVSAGPFTLTALPAADGIGDPQVSWLVEADGARVLHLGDTMFHGFWWRMALRHGPFDAVLTPVNGAVLSFPHRQPPSSLPGALDPEQAALACELLRTGLAVPIHAEGYDLDGVYEPVRDARDNFAAAAAERELPIKVLEPGETIEITSAHVEPGEPSLRTKRVIAETGSNPTRT